MLSVGVRLYKGVEFINFEKKIQGVGLFRKIRLFESLEYPVLTKGDVTPITFNFMITTVFKRLKPLKIRAKLVIQF